MFEIDLPQHLSRWAEFEQDETPLRPDKPGGGGSSPSALLVDRHRSGGTSPPVANQRAASSSLCHGNPALNFE